MSRRMLTLALLIAPLAVAPLACGGDADDRTALEEEELGRELDLALEGDTLPATFEDTAAGAEQPQQADQRAQAPQRAPARAQPQPTQPRRTQPAPSPRPRTVTRTVPTGTTFALRLNETLSTETNKAGDGFTATLSEPIMGVDGTVIVPAGATVRGRVTGVNKSGRVGETAVISLAFEAISFGGESHPLSATVVEANPERKSRTSAGETAGKVAAGAAAGAILGQIIGKDKESTLKGAAIGAAAGTAIAMGTADVDAVLPAGSRLVIRLDSPVEVQRTVS